VVDELGDEQIAAVGDGRHKAYHLQGGHQQIALADGDVDRVGASPGAAQVLPHPGRAGHLPRRFRQVADAGRRAEAHPQGVVGQQVGIADVHIRPGLVEVGVAGADQRLGQRQRAVTVGLPVIAGVVAGGSAVPDAGAHVTMIEGVDAAVGDGGHGDGLEGRAGRVGALRHAVDLRLALVVLHLDQALAGVGAGAVGVEQVGVKPGVAGQGQNLAGVHIYDHDRRATGHRRPVGNVVGVAQHLLGDELQARIDGQVDAFTGPRLGAGQGAQHIAARREDLQLAAGLAAQHLVPGALDAADADDGILRHAARPQLREHLRRGVADIADHVRGQAAGHVAAGGALLKGGVAVVDQRLALQGVGLGVDLADQRHPVGGAAVEDVLQLGVAQAQDAGQGSFAVVQAGDILLHDRDRDGDAGLVDQHVAVAVVDVGPDGHPLVEDDRAAAGHLGEDVAGGPGHAPAFLRSHQAQGAAGVGEATQEAGVEGHVVADSRRIALQQAGAQGVIQRLQRHFLGDIAVHPGEDVFGVGLPAAEADQGVHGGVIRPLPGLQVRRGDGLRLPQSQLDGRRDGLLSRRDGRQRAARRQQQGCQRQQSDRCCPCSHLCTLPQEQEAQVAASLPHTHAPRSSGPVRRRLAAPLRVDHLAGL